MSQEFALVQRLSSAARRAVGLTRETRRHWRTRPDDIQLSWGFPYPASFPIAELLEAAQMGLGKEGDRALQYGGGDACRRLERWVRDRLQQRGVQLHEVDCLITCGSSQALGLVAQVMVDPGDLVVVEGPTFMGALRAFRNAGAQLHQVTLEDDGPDLRALREWLEERLRGGQPMPKVFYTVPNFHNPTGCCMSLDKRRCLVELAERYGFLIVEDDAYGDLRFEGEDLPPLKAFDRQGVVAYVGTFSKTIAPGIRIGWIFGAEPLIAAMARLKADGGTSPFVQTVVAYYCEGANFDRRVEVLRANYRRRRDVMLHALERYMPADCRWTRPQGGFFVWLHLPEGIDSRELLAKAIDHGVSFVDGRPFFADVEEGARYLRLAFCYVPEDRMAEGIRRLTQALEELLETGP
mgnify:CR=1 FL=1